MDVSTSFLQLQIHNNSNKVPCWFPLDNIYVLYISSGCTEFSLVVPPKWPVCHCLGMHRSQHGRPVFQCLVICEIVKTAVEREPLQHLQIPFRILIFLCLFLTRDPVYHILLFVLFKEIVMWFYLHSNWLCIEPIDVNRYMFYWRNYPLLG